MTIERDTISQILLVLTLYQLMNKIDEYIKFDKKKYKSDNKKKKHNQIKINKEDINNKNV